MSQIVDVTRNAFLTSRRDNESISVIEGPAGCMEIADEILDDIRFLSHFMYKAGIFGDVHREAIKEAERSLEHFRALMDGMCEYWNGYYAMHNRLKELGGLEEDNDYEE